MIEQGQSAPDFTLHDTEKKPRTLNEFLQNATTVLAFFPGAFTGVCTREMCAFRDSLQEFVKEGSQIVGISVNDPFTNKAFAAQNNLQFPVLSDYSREVVRKYGVFHENFSGLQGYTAAKRSVFVLDKNGVVRYRWVTEDPSKEPNYDELRRVVGKAH